LVTVLSLFGDDDADLRQQINAEQAGDAKRNFAEPIRERRADAAGEPEFMPDGEKLRQVPRRREIEQRRDHQPNEGLCQRREPEQQLWP